MTLQTEEGKVWSQRQDVDPNPEQAHIAAAAGVSFRHHHNLVSVDNDKVPASEAKEKSHKVW